MNQKYLKRIIASYVREKDVPYIADAARDPETVVKQFKYLENEKLVIIFDECHRSQFGQTHARIKGFFKKAQLFGFTGTPIFAMNANHLGQGVLYVGDEVKVLERGEPFVSHALAL